MVFELVDKGGGTRHFYVDDKHRGNLDPTRIAEIKMKDDTVFAYSKTRRQSYPDMPETILVFKEK